MTTTIVWFRQDLRVGDNPALAAAAKMGDIIPLYIIETPLNGARDIGDAGKWWLHQSLLELDKSLGSLLVLRGKPGDLLPKLAKASGATNIVWNRCYEPNAIARDTAIKADLVQRGLTVESYNAALLFEPWEVKNGSGQPFKVYSPFWRACLARGMTPPKKSQKFTIANAKTNSLPPNDWQLLPTKPNWAAGWEMLWTPGEVGALKRLDAFLANDLQGYGELRNRPDLPNISRLSPHLHWGEISPRQVAARTTMAVDAEGRSAKDATKFLSEIGWREFAYQLLYNFPTLPSQNWKPAFDAYPWRTNKSDLKAWQRGQTGYPLVDAGMRELWHTGYMHNRVRMVVASFLIKHLRIDWRQGEAWFWDTLLDADLANNAASWQWVAGSGADAAPYFRIFNPIEQGRKFDPNGDYIRKWVPELGRLSNDDLFWPHDAPPMALKSAGITLGKTYPHPIVDHAEARIAAMKGYEAVKQAGANVSNVA
ncbi:MAG: deoxyribodipyrimidine photo-lyase [Hyphomicrobiaceae bacterium]|nr:deoxyribodipyrimidine photo-lyase [Hyphomicrobiaceae bacterium]